MEGAMLALAGFGLTSYPGIILPDRYACKLTYTCTLAHIITWTYIFTLLYIFILDSIFTLLA